MDKLLAWLLALLGFINTPYFYPIPQFNQRITAKSFGQLVTPADAKKFSCGAPFSGYHTGTDLETYPGETDIPVYAVTNSKIVYAGRVPGYGGIVVLSNQEFTFYYGHVKPDNLRVGTSVSKGQQLTVLGKGCTAETDFERSHLHFAIHKGTALDFRGYINSQEELSAWLDPQEMLKSNHAF